MIFCSVRIDDPATQTLPSIEYDYDTLHSTEYNTLDRFYRLGNIYRDMR